MIIFCFNNRIKIEKRLRGHGKTPPASMLYPFQLETVKKMEMFDKGVYTVNTNGDANGENVNVNVNSKISILSSNPGTGKTLMILEMISRNKGKTSDFHTVTPLNVNFEVYISTKNDKDCTRPRTTLIICAPSVLHQWENELDRYTDLKYRVFDPKSAESEDVDVLLCSKTWYRKLCSRRFSRIVIDDIYKVKTHLLDYNHLWLVTSDPKDLYFKGDYGLINQDLIEYITVSCFYKYEHVVNEFYYECSNPCDTCSSPESLKQLFISEKPPRDNLDSIISKIDDIPNTNCCICLDTVKDPVMVMCCNTVFCYTCLDTFARKNGARYQTIKCALCRQVVYKTVRVRNSVSVYSKTERCLNIIKEKPEGKILVITTDPLKFKELKGGKPVKKIVNKYNNTQGSVITINPKNIRTGVNLEKTTDIIIFGDIVSTKEAVSKALRLSRPTNQELNVHYLKN